MSDTIEVRCSCGTRTKTAARNAGRRARCPGCGARILVPNPEIDLGAGEAGQAERVQTVAVCECGHREYGPAEQEGQAVPCPTCCAWMRFQSTRDRRRTWRGLSAL